MFAPARRRGTEMLDDPGSDPALALRSLHDIAKANLLFGGRRAVVRELRRRMARQTGPVRLLLDIGTGLGDIPAASRRAAASARVDLRTIGLELAPALARAARPACNFTVVGDALHLPFADASIDIVTCSQVLHHFDDAEAETLLRECTRVASEAVVIADLRRSWLAIGGLWLASFALRFHPVSRHDGIVSILRGYTAPELRSLVARVIGVRPEVRYGLGWRVTAVWGAFREPSIPAP